MAYIPLVNQETGEIDGLAIAERAELRAYREWGGPDPSPAYRREALQWVADRAADERRVWRREHHLPSDEPSTLMHLPSWGASGDSFGAR